MISRRALLFAAPAFIAAPAIVRAANIMSVKPIAPNNRIIAQWLDPVLNTAFDGHENYHVYDWVSWGFRYDGERWIEYRESCPPNPTSC